MNRFGILWGLVCAATGSLPAYADGWLDGPRAPSAFAVGRTVPSARVSLHARQMRLDDALQEVVRQALPLRPDAWQSLPQRDRARRVWFRLESATFEQALEVLSAGAGQQITDDGTSLVFGPWLRTGTPRPPTGPELKVLAQFIQVPGGERPAGDVLDEVARRIGKVLVMSPMVQKMTIHVDHCGNVAQLFEAISLAMGGRVYLDGAYLRVGNERTGWLRAASGKQAPDIHVPGSAGPQKLRSEVARLARLAGLSPAVELQIGGERVQGATEPSTLREVLKSLNARGDFRVAVLGPFLVADGPQGREFARYDRVYEDWLPLRELVFPRSGVTRILETCSKRRDAPSSR